MLNAFHVTRFKIVTRRKFNNGSNEHNNGNNTRIKEVHPTECKTKITSLSIIHILMNYVYAEYSN